MYGHKWKTTSCTVINDKLLEAGFTYPEVEGCGSEVEGCCGSEVEGCCAGSEGSVCFLGVISEKNANNMSRRLDLTKKIENVNKLLYNEI